HEHHQKSGDERPHEIDRRGVGGGLCCHGIDFGARGRLRQQRDRRREQAGDNEHCAPLETLHSSPPARQVRVGSAKNKKPPRSSIETRGHWNSSCSANSWRLYPERLITSHRICGSGRLLPALGRGKREAGSDMTGLLVAADTSNPGRGTIFRHYPVVKASLQNMQDWIVKMQNCGLKMLKCMHELQNMRKCVNTLLLDRGINRVREVRNCN